MAMVTLGYIHVGTKYHGHTHYFSNIRISFSGGVYAMYNYLFRTVVLVMAVVWYISYHSSQQLIDRNVANSDLWLEVFVAIM